MRSLLWSLAVAAALLAGCTDDGDSGNTETYSCTTLAAVGTWRNTSFTTDLLTVSSDCTAESTYCNNTMEFTLPDQSDGSMTLTILQPNFTVNCLDQGSYSCEYEQDGIFLRFDCGGFGQFEYQEEP